MRLAVLFLMASYPLLPAMCQSSSPYKTEKTTVDGLEVYVLRDTARKIEVFVAPAFGNNAYDLRVNGKSVLWTPAPTLGELVQRSGFGGNPLLWPWANRIDQLSYWANGKKYLLNAELGNLRLDGNKQPIHGLIAYSKDWKVTRVEANATAAEVTSRLEFARYPQLMAQFPFAHVIEMTYRLKDGALEVATRIENQSTDPMPVSLGYHPYFRLHDAPRDEWRVRLAAKTNVKLTRTLVPSGEMEPNDKLDTISLGGVTLDDVFTDLVPGPGGRAVFSVEGKREKIEVEYGPKYTVAVVYAPPGRGFICFEPMTAPTNAFNGAQAGWYKGLQSIPPGGVWSESFWIRASGF